MLPDVKIFYKVIKHTGLANSVRIRSCSVRGKVFSREVIDPASIAHQVFYAQAVHEPDQLHVFSLISPHQEVSEDMVGDEGGLIA